MSTGTSPAGQGKAMARNMISGSLQGLRRQQEELASDLAAQKTQFQGCGDAISAEVFERITRLRESKLKAEADLAKTADVERLELEKESKSTQAARIKSQAMSSPEEFR